MSTSTIQLEKSTKDILNELKESFNSTTYDEVIKKLLKKKTGSMFGALGKGRKISVKEMMKGLRDKHDRI